MSMHEFHSDPMLRDCNRSLLFTSVDFRSPFELLFPLRDTPSTVLVEDIPPASRDTRYGFSDPAQFICFHCLRGLRTWLIHAWIYRGQFSSLVPSTSQLARKSTASWLTSVTSRKSKTNYWLAASKASSSCSFLTFSASILPLSLKTTRLLPDR